MAQSTRQEHISAFKSAMQALRRGERSALATWMRGHLMSRVMLFWDGLEDREHGGLFTCVSDDGTVVSTDKWLWSQWRAVWVCARMFNTVDADPRWRERAERIARFCLAHGWRESEAGWSLLLEQDGTEKRGYESIYVDGFAVYGLAELSRATGDPTWLARAEATASAALDRIAAMGDQLPHFPYAIPAGTKPHGVPMIWSLKLAALTEAGGAERWREAGVGMLAEIDRDFYDPEEDRIRETVARGEGRASGPEGTVTVPGHVVEALWFRRVVEEAAGSTLLPREETWRRVRRHLELGWEQASGGGLLLAVDGAGQVAADGWPMADLKLWWPVTEAMIASLMAWQDTGEEGWLDWYERLWDLALAHYVDWEHGEWRQKLHRDLSPFSGTVALPVKDPFHLPRSLILQCEMLESGRIPRP